MRSVIMASDPIERASQSDRAWFALHPHENERIRLRIEGEFGPCETQAGRIDDLPLVVVTQIQPGFRLRRAVAFVEWMCMS